MIKSMLLFFCFLVAVVDWSTAWSNIQIPSRIPPTIKANHLRANHPIPTLDAVRRGPVPCAPRSSLLGCAATSSSDDNNLNDEEETQAKEVEKQTMGARIKSYFLQSKKDDGLSFKQRLAKMGVATVLSYGMISNLSYAVLIAISWYLFSVQTKLSPLCPGQWKPFLAVYASFWMFNNIIRPLRVGLSIAIAPSLDKLVLFFQNRLKVSKPVAVTVTVVFVNVIGTTLLMVGGISLAALLAGVPIFPAKKLLV